MNPEVQQAIDNINQYIVENHNNEITANILNPILIELANLFDLVGDLSELNTTEKDSVVLAINWLMTQINSGIEIHVGTDDPNVTPPDNYAVGDLYSRLNVLGDPYQIYMYNGVEWGEIQRVINDLIISNDSTWSSEKISQAIQGDRFDTLPTISLIDNDITITNSSWWIQGVNYNLIPDFEDTIPYTSGVGLFRKDIIVAVASNNFVRIEGVESDTNPFEPTVPPNTLLVTSIDVFHDSIGEPTEPILGSNYIPKASEGWFTYMLNSANPEAIPTLNAQFNINFLALANGHIIPGLNIISTASKIWNGGMIAIRNNSPFPITLKHLGSSGKIRFDFSNTKEDFVLTNDNGVKYFKLGVIPSTGNAIAYCLNDFVSGGGATTSDDVSNESNVTGATVTEALDELQEQLSDLTADQVSYDNTASGLDATNVQELGDALYETKEDRVSVVPITANTTITASHHGKILLITADVVVTFPAGLGAGFTGCAFRIATGGKMTPAFGSGVTGNDFFADYNPGESLYVFKESNSTNIFYAV